MADHRKSFRPRRLSRDGRLLPRGRLFGAALALLGALLLAGPAFAQDIGLRNGKASLDAGKYDQAARQLSATVNDQRATPAQAAEALYLRGIAYRKLGQPGRAIADLGAGIWLGLSGSDKARALVNKGLAYRAVGLTSQAEAALSEARRASPGEAEKFLSQDGATAVATAGSESFSSEGSSSGSSGESVWSRIVPGFGSTSSPPPAPAAEAAAPSPAPAPTAEAAPSSGWSASVSERGTEEGGTTRVGRWFGSLTGESAPAPEQAAAPVTPAPAPAPQTTTSAPKTAAAPPSSASWSANTTTTSAAAESEGGTAVGRWFARATDSAPSTAVTETPRAAPRGGGYTVQLANSRSQAEAQALWKQAQRSNAQLASAAPRIEKVDIGSFGTFYSVKIGPFADEAEGARICNALKRGGTDCSVVAPDGP